MTFHVLNPKKSCFTDFDTEIELFLSLCIFLITGFNLPYCNTPESYRNTDKVADNLFFFGQWNPNNCNCQQQCLKHLFTSSLESTTDRYSIKKGRNKARVRVYYQVRIILRSKIFIFSFNVDFVDFSSSQNIKPPSWLNKNVLHR